MGRICFFNTAIAWGGGEKWHLEVSSYLHGKAHDVLVVAHRKSELLKRVKKAQIPYEAIEINNLSFLNPLKHLKIRKLFKQYDIDTVVMNLSRDVKVAAPSAKAAGVTSIIYRRGSAIPIKNTFLNRYYFKSTITDILANSEATKKTVLQNNANLFPKNKIKVIYNGVEIPQNIEKKEYKESPKRAEFTILTVGRLEAQKNQKFLIHLAKELLERKLQFKICIGGEGRLREELEKLIVDLEVGGHVVLAGFIKNPMEFIDNGDIFVLPSLWEGFGYVLAEAALCKKPIIAFDTSSNPELVVNNKSGYLISPGDIKGFANAIENLYRRPELAKKMGEKGFEYVKNHFDKKKKLQEIEVYLLNG